MMSYKVNKKLVLLFIVLITAIIFLSGVSPIKNKEANAEGQEVFQMVNSASIRLDGNGLRFKVKMNEAVKDKINFKDVNLYFIIMPEKYLSVVNGNYSMAISRTEAGEFDLENSHCMYVRVNGNIYSGGDGYYYANGGVSNVKAANYKETFVAIACIERNNAGTYSYEYAAVSEGANTYPAVDLYTAINKAMLYDKENYYNDIVENYSWYGTKNYPVYIDTQEGYNEFVTKINGGCNFSSFNVEIMPNVSVSGEDVVEFTDENTLPSKTSRYFTVKYYDKVDGELITEYVVKSGEKIEKPQNPVRVSDGRKDYVFLYWQYGERAWNFNEDVVEDNIELFAIWEEKSFSVDFEL